MVFLSFSTTTAPQDSSVTVKQPSLRFASLVQCYNNKANASYAQRWILLNLVFLLTML